MRGGGAAAAGVVGRLKARTSGDGGPPASGAEGGAGGPPSPSPTGPGGGAGGGAAAREAPAAEAAPAWARKLRRSQAISAGVTAAANAVRSGDHSGGSAAVPLDEEKP
jgi:type IV secretion system protein TrbL